MTEDDRQYYLRRAEEEILRAQASTEERAVRFHYLLGALYLDRVYGDGSEPPRPLSARAPASPIRGAQRSRPGARASRPTARQRSTDGEGGGRDSDPRPAAFRAARAVRGAHSRSDTVSGRSRRHPPARS